MHHGVSQHLASSAPAAALSSAVMPKSRWICQIRRGRHTHDKPTSLEHLLKVYHATDTIRNVIDTYAPADCADDTDDEQSRRGGHCHKFLWGRNSKNSRQKIQGAQYGFARDGHVRSSSSDSSPGRTPPPTAPRVSWGVPAL